MSTTSVSPCFVDRSRIETFQSCHRKRFFEYHFAGVGIVRKGLQVELATGSAIHSCLEDLGDGVGGSERLDAIIRGNQHYYRNEAKENGLLIEPVPDNVEQDIQEQLDLIEALVRLHEILLAPQDAQEYETLASESEITYEIAPGMNFMARPDKVLRRRSDGVVIVRNYKSTANPDMTWRDQWRYDMQVISEVEAVKKSLGVDVWGVQIVGLVKGRRSEFDGRYSHNNSLIYCWVPKDKNSLGTSLEMYPSYEYTCDSPHSRCSGGKKHRLGPSYEKRAVREVFPGGIKGWLEHLRDHYPGVLEQYLLVLPPVIVPSHEVDQWRRTVVAQEQRIQNSLEHEDLTDPEKLDEAFPMYTAHGNCLRPRKCQFFPICWEGAGLNPNELYRWRTPNHPQELVQIGKGLSLPIPSVWKEE